MNAAPASPFWTFSLRTYARPGVSEACLELQEAAGVDVNVLLYLLWLATLGRRVSAAELDAAMVLVEPWRRTIVGPLRQARRASKEAPAGFDGASVLTLRQAIKRAELEAERLQQDALYAWRRAEIVGEAAAPAAAARANVEAYAQALALRFAETPQALIIAAALSSEGEARS